MIANMIVTPLEHRAILRLSGEAPIAFLQDILTADIASLAPHQMRQSCLLSPQGRILVEMTIFIPPQSDDEELLYLACDKRQQEELIKKLKLYRLRRKIDFRICDTLCLIATDEPINADDCLISAPDTRAPDRGYLSIITTDSLSDSTVADPHLYHAKRMADAIPEGPDELVPNRALMLEAGLHLFDAVDFKKGCYIGQEVTARTHYRGLVKRRLVPVRAQKLHQGANVMLGDKEVGTILATSADAAGAIGLASMRLVAIHDAEAGERLVCEGNPISLVIPEHLRPIPKPS